MKLKRTKIGLFSERNISELLCSIRKDELRQFNTYLKTNCTQSTHYLWRVIKTKLNDAGVTDKAILKAFGKNKPITDKHYRVLLAELSKHTKDYIIEREFEQNELLYTNTLANALLKRRAQKNYKKTRQQNERRFTVNRKPDADYYEHYHQHKLIDFQFTTLYEPLKTEDSLQQASDYHDYSFLVKKLRYLTILRNRQRIVRTSYNEQNEEEFIQYLLKFPLDELPLIKAYYLMVRLFQHSSYRNYIAFKDHLFPIRDQFDRGEVRQLLTLAGNICFWNVQEGKLEFLEERFNVSKIMVEENFLQVLGYFSNNHFQTTLINAIEARKLDWAFWFLENKLPDTHPEHRTNLELLGWASLYLAKGELKKQEQYMHQMQLEDYKFTDYYNELAYRTLRLKTDFILLGNNPKQRVREAFQAHLSNYLRYCERKTDIPPITRKARENFGIAARLVFNKYYGKKGLRTS